MPVEIICARKAQPTVAGGEPHFLAVLAVMATPLIFKAAVEALNASQRTCRCIDT